MARRIDAIEQRLVMIEERPTVPPIQVESSRDVANSENFGAPLDADTSEICHISQATPSAADNQEDSQPRTNVVRRHRPPGGRHSQLKPKFHLARLDSTRHDSTRSTCRAHAFWLCRASRTSQLDSLDTTNSTGSTGSTRRARQARLAT